MGETKLSNIEFEKNSEFLRNDPRFSVTPFQQMAAACSGGIITSFLMTPLDVVKIRLQAQQSSTQVIHKCFVYCNGLMDHYCPCLPTETANSSYSFWYSRPNHFTGTLDAFVKISRTEGVASLWSGLSPTLVLALPATIVYFVTYDQLKLKFKTVSDRRINLKRVKNGLSPLSNPEHPIWVPLLSGCVARTWAVTCVSPLELIRTKMQSKKLSYLEMSEAVRSLLRYHGFLGLWKGLIPTLMRDVPFSGIYWVTYESIKSRMHQNSNTFIYSFLAGSISGTIAAVTTTPFDVLKTVYQIDLMDKEIMTEPPGRGLTLLMTLKSIYEKNGVAGLFAGLVPRLVKVVPACAIMIASFEYGKQYFYKKNVKQFLQEEQNMMS